MEIAGKVAVVSGGGSGIGRAAVLALVNRGAEVVVADVDEDAGRQTVGLAAEKGGTAVFCRCDVTKTEDLAGALASAVEHFGALHIAFNNAGIGGEDLFADDPGDWARVIDVDLIAVIDTGCCPPCERNLTKPKPRVKIVFWSREPDHSSPDATCPVSAGRFPRATGFGCSKGPARWCVCQVKPVPVRRRRC